MITRQQHLDDRDPDGKAAHRRYYAQFVTPDLIGLVVLQIGAERIKRSTDPAMNDIPLGEWDAFERYIATATRAKLREAGDFPTLGNAVCIAKEAARQWKEQQPTKGEA